MIDDIGPQQLEMRWLSVTDERGRARMEAVWILPAAHPSTTQAA